MTSEYDRRVMISHTEARMLGSYEYYCNPAFDEAMNRIANEQTIANLDICRFCPDTMYKYCCVHRIIKR